MKNRQLGFSLLEVLIAIGLMSLVAVSTATLIGEQNKQIKLMSQKIVLNDTKNAFLATMQDTVSCQKNLDSSVDGTLVFDSTLVGNKSMPLARIRIGHLVTSPILLDTTLEVSPGSRLFVNSITLDNLTDVGGGKWSGVWKVDFRNDFSSFQFKAMVLNPQLFDVDVSTPTVAKITNCSSVVAGGSGQWASLNAVDIYYSGGKVGIGTTAPAAQLEITENFKLPVTTGVAGQILQGANRIFHSFGTNSLFLGSNSGNLALTGTNNLGIGNQAGFALTTGSHNTFVGDRAGANNTTGSSNSFFGRNVAENSTTGAGNTSVGYHAARTLTVGNNNTYIGNAAGYTDGTISTPVNLVNSSAIGFNAQVTANNSMVLGGTGAFAVKVGIGTTAPTEQLDITGNFNLPSSTATTGILKQANGSFIHSVGTQSFFAGNLAGTLANTGSFNTGVGYTAMKSVTSGTINTAVGHRTGESITTGNYNTAVGAGAMAKQTTSNDNAAFGSNSLGNNIVGVGNAYVGDSSGRRTEGSYNSGIGQQVMYTLVGGSFNSGIGNNAGTANIGGSSNTFLGTNANTTADGFNFATAVGAGALVGASNSLVLGAPGTNVGIGVSVPVRTLDVQATNARIMATSTTNNNAAAVRAFNGISEITLGVESNAGGALMTGTLPYAALLSSDFSWPLQFAVFGGVKMTILTDGSVGIGTAAPTQKLEVNGTIKTIDLIYSSDRRSKHNIMSLSPEESLEKICAIRPVSFDWNYSDRHDQGVIAQELQSVFPDFVVQGSDGKYSVKYNSLLAPLISAVQFLNMRLSRIETNTKILEEKVARLEIENKMLLLKQSDLEARQSKLELKIEKLLSQNKSNQAAW